MNFPLIGVTAGVEWRAESRPYRPVLLSDSKIHDALRRYGCAPVLLPHEIEAVDLYCSRLDGLFVAGGGFQFPDEERLIADGPEVADADRIFYRRAAFELALVKSALALDLPILGVCGGFQVLNAVTGGKLIVSLERSFPAGESHLVLPADVLAHPVNVDPASRVFKLAQQHRFEVNSLHRQGVSVTGPDVLVAARSDDGLVEAIEVPSRTFAVGVQWHPEFLLTHADESLIGGFVSACRQRAEHRS